MPTVDLSPYHQPPGSTSDGAKFDNLIDLVQATLNGIDNNNFASGKIFDPTKIMQNSALDADALVWDNTNSQWVRSSTATRLRPPGYQFDYAEQTANVSVTATSSATANAIVTGAAVTYDGSTSIIVEFYCSHLSRGTNNITVELFDGAASLGVMTFNGLGANAPAGTFRRRLTPSAAAHTYAIKAYVDAGTGSVLAGAGGSAGTVMPAFLRVTKA